jgi:hypothetical protein
MNGLSMIEDVQEVRAYVAALEDPAAPSAMLHRRLCERRWNHRK